MTAPPYFWVREDADLADLARLAAYLSLDVHPGDVIALEGDLGAGKTTFARSLIGCLSEGGVTEVPSPTFTLIQCYELARMTVFHADLYRLASETEAAEIGLEDALATGLTLIEWPDRIRALLPPDRLDLDLAEGSAADRRRITLTGHGTWAPRLERLAAMMAFTASAGLGAAAPRFLLGDASTRAYSRIDGHGRPLILMDSPRRPDGPPIRDGKPYSAIAHLAEDVSAFVAVGEALRSYGLSAPELHAADLDHGFLLIEDLGDRVFGAEIAAGRPMAPLYQAAVDVLIALRTHAPPAVLPVPGGGGHDLAGFDLEALTIEIELLTDWYYPAAMGQPIPEAVKADFLSRWVPLLTPLASHREAWVLRDYHSPNLIWLPERTGLARVGIIDYQDAMRGHAAYDLVSLLQDARLDAPADLEQELLDRYCATVASQDRSFDADEFRLAYAVCGAERNTKILGIFARLAMRDGKFGYLRHMPRIWGYLERNLAHPGLKSLRAWYDGTFPAAGRALCLSIGPGAREATG